MVQTVERKADASLPAAFIVEAVGEVARPRAGLPLRTHGLETLPGKLGMVSGIANAMAWMRRGRAHVVEQARKLGPIYKYQFFNIPAVFVSDPELIAAIGRNDDRAWSAALAWRVFFEGIDPTATHMDSLATLDFEVHKDVRKWMQPAFSGAALTSYLATATPMFEQTIDGWRARGRVDFKAEVRRMFAKVAGRIFLGIEDDGVAEMLDRALADYWRAPLALVRNRLGRTWRRAQDGGQRLYDWLVAKIPERRASSGTDLFSRMCQTKSDTEWIDDQAIVRLFMGVLAGAFDTTACAVTSMGYELARNTAWQNRLREGTPDEIEWAWKETLRLYPVAADIPRRALRDVELGGHRIPAGTMVLALLAVVQNDPTIWTEPERFDPERFSPARAEDKRKKGVFLPFGTGAHACIGAQLSTQEAVAFWQAMLKRCRFELERPYTAAHQFTPLGMLSGDVALTIRPA